MNTKKLEKYGVFQSWLQEEQLGNSKQQRNFSLFLLEFKHTEVL